MLCCSNLYVKYGNFTALSNVNLEFKPGYIHILFGPNGAGKTTLLKVLSGVLMPTAGSILYNQTDMHHDSLHFFKRMGFLSHDISLYNNMTAIENLSFWASLYSIPEKDARIDELLRSVELKEFGDKFVKQFSRGMKQRLAIAKSLLHRPDVLIWDEPFTGIDIMTTEIICSILKCMQQEGSLIILTMHDLLSGYELGDYLYIINKGRVVSQLHKSSLSYKEFHAMFNQLQK